MMLKNNYLQHISLSSVVIISIFIFAVWFRIPMFDQVGKDNKTFLETVIALSSGENPYVFSIRQFEDMDKTSGGYAYLPGLMYVYYFLYLVSVPLNISFIVLWKLPVLFAEIGVGILLLKILKDKDIGIKIISLCVWFFNPYIITNLKYQYNDSIPVFFLLLALFYLTKDRVKCGAFYALAIIFKTFPIFLFPALFVKKTKNLQFVLSGLIIAILVSLPFMLNINDFFIYLKGSFFIHGGREVTGRPFLFYISYFYKIEFIRMIPIYVFTYLAVFTPGIVIIIGKYLFKIADQYILVTLGLLSFLIFTPVLNRTYIIWILPTFLITAAKIKGNKYIFYALVGISYAFYSWYLLNWVDGFQTTIPQV